MDNPADQPVWGFLKWAFAIIIGLALMASFIVPGVGPRPSGARTVCMNNIRHIATALHNYHSDFGSLPPAYVAAASGRPMHSWRVLILPYVDRPDLYSVYRFDEPWNGPENSKLRGVIVDDFCCPQDHKGKKSPETSYAALVGPETIWPRDKCAKLDDVADGLGNTLLVVEVANSGIHWMEPRDLDSAHMPLKLNDRTALGISSSHPGGAIVAFADGRVRFLSDSISPRIVKALMTIQGGEVIHDSDY